MHGPVIQGELVRLRPLVLEEAPFLRQFFEDPEVTRFLGMINVPSLEFEQEWLRTRSDDKDNLGWGIEFEGRLVGYTGLDIDWARQQASTGTVIGDKTAWGKGIATEAMIMRRDYAFRYLSLRKLTSSYIADNEASGKAQRKAGYEHCGRRREEIYRDGAWRDLILTEILRYRWEALVATF